MVHIGMQQVVRYINYLFELTFTSIVLNILSWFLFVLVRYFIFFTYIFQLFTFAAWINNSALNRYALLILLTVSWHYQEILSQGNRRWRSKWKFLTNFSWCASVIPSRKLIKNRICLLNHTKRSWWETST
jgi:hypothetical protein